MTDHTRYTPAVMYALTHSYCKGEEAALALKPGDYFPGATGAAVQAGYEMHTLEFCAFVSGYMQGLETTFVDGKECTKKHVTVDHTNHIISIRDQRA